MQGLAVNRPISSRPLQLHRQVRIVVWQSFFVYVSAASQYCLLIRLVVLAITMIDSHDDT